LGNLPEAKTYFQKALQTTMEDWVPAYALHALVGMIKLLAVVEDKETALELALFVNQHPASWQWSKDSIASLIAELEAELPPKVVTAARARGKEKTLEGVIAVFLS
jgi:hypothetical protein